MWFPVHVVDVLLKAKNVNNERIKRELDGIVIDVIKRDWAMLQTVEDQGELAEYIEDCLKEHALTESALNDIEVICDNRNNTRQDCDDGKINLAVRYQQHNCLNVTELAYEIIL